MSANVYNEPGSSNIYLTLANNTAAILLSELGPCKVGLETDNLKLMVKDHLGAAHSVMFDESVSTLRVPMKSGSAWANSPIYIDSYKIGLSVASPAAKVDMTAEAYNIPFMYGRVTGTAHGMTSYYPTDVVFALDTVASGSVKQIGGLMITGMTYTSSLYSPLLLRGFAGISPSVSCISIQAGKKNGTAVQALSDSELAFSVSNYSSTIMSIIGSGSTYTYNDLYIVKSKNASLISELKNVSQTSLAKTLLKLTGYVNPGTPAEGGITLGVDNWYGSGGACYLNSTLALSINIGSSPTEVIQIAAAGVGIGCTPVAALDVVGAFQSQVRLRSSIIDNTTKYGCIQFGSTLNAQPDVTLICGKSALGTNEIYIGGGPTALNSTNNISFYTSQAYNTLQGDLRMIIDDYGKVGVGTHNSLTIYSKMCIDLSDDDLPPISFRANGLGVQFIHTMSDFADTLAWGIIDTRKDDTDRANGGMRITGIAAAESYPSLTLVGASATIAPNAGIACIDMIAYKSDGSTSVAAIAATDMALKISTSTTALMSLYGGGYMKLYSGTPPVSVSVGEIAAFSVTSSDNTATLGLFLEQTVEDIGIFTPTKKLKIKINGLEYWMQLDPVA